MLVPFIRPELCPVQTNTYGSTDELVQWSLLAKTLWDHIGPVIVHTATDHMVFEL